MKLLKISVILLLSAMCSKEVLGMNLSKEELKEINPHLSRLSKTFHTASAIIIFKLLPPPSWTTEYRFGEGCYGFTFGIGLYPRFLRFMNGDLKIGFLFFEHRTWEIIPKTIHMLVWDLKNNTHYTIMQFTIAALFFPLSLSLLSIKYKYVRINMVSLFEITKCLAIYCQGNIGKHDVGIISIFLFSTNKNHQYALCNNFWISFIVFLFPRLAIDMSYFANKDEKRDEEEKPIEF